MLYLKALVAIGWTALQTQLKQRRQAGERVGAGLALFVDKSGLGPFDAVRIRRRRGSEVARARGSDPRRPARAQRSTGVLRVSVARAFGLEFHVVRGALPHAFRVPVHEPPTW